MSNYHQNATPNMVFTGAKENPAPGPAPVLAGFSNLTTLNFIRGNWGPDSEALAIADSVTGRRWFGAECLDIDSPYYNYQSVLAEGLMGKAVTQFLVRITDENVKKAASRLMIEYVAEDIDPQERNLDGSFKLDADGNTIDAGSTVAGYNIRFLLELSDGSLVTGDGQTVQGTLTGKDGATSSIVPILDLEGTWAGTRGNNLLTGLFQPKTSNVNPVDAATIEAKGTMLYRMMVREVTGQGGSTIPWYTIGGNEFIDFALQPMVRNVSGSTCDFDTRYREGYQLKQQLTNAANVTGPFDGLHWYVENIKTVLGLLHAAEKTARPVAGDNTIWIDDDNIYSINLFGATNHQGIPYRAVKHIAMGDNVADARQIVLSSTGPTIKMAGGNDGTMTDATFNQGIRDFVDTFGQAIPLTDVKQYPFHWVFDMGLELDTTKKLGEITKHRPDVAVIGSTHEHGRVNTQQEIIDKLAAISSAYSLIPESVVYSTPATRGAVHPYAIRIKGHQYQQPISMLYRTVMKLADYLGSNDLVWDTDKDPLHKNNKNIEDEILNYKYNSYPIREKMWMSQGIAIESTGHERVGLMGLQSINPNDSSPLNSLIAVAAVLQANWAMAMAHGEWCGGTMTPALIKQRCDESIAERCRGIDPEKARVVPNTIITKEDADNGFSYTMQCQIFVGNQYTAATITIDVSFFQAAA